MQIRRDIVRVYRAKIFFKRKPVYMGTAFDVLSQVFNKAVFFLIEELNPSNTLLFFQDIKLFAYFVFRIFFFLLLLNLLA